MVVPSAKFSKSRTGKNLRFQASADPDSGNPWAPAGWIPSALKSLPGAAICDRQARDDLGIQSPMGTASARVRGSQRHPRTVSRSSSSLPAGALVCRACEHRRLGWEALAWTG